jgi:hypothetical protein
MAKRASQPQATKQAPADDGNGEMQTTAIVIPKTMWNLLREVAFRRAQSSGGRASVSEVLRSLVESHRTELEKEIRHK